MPPPTPISHAPCPRQSARGLGRTYVPTLEKSSTPLYAENKIKREQSVYRAEGGATAPAQTRAYRRRNTTQSVGGLNSWRGGSNTKDPYKGRGGGGGWGQGGEADGYEV